MKKKLAGKKNCAYMYGCDGGKKCGELKKRTVLKTRFDWTIFAMVSLCTQIYLHCNDFFPLSVVVVGSHEFNSIYSECALDILLTCWIQHCRCQHLAKPKTLNRLHVTHTLQRINNGKYWRRAKSTEKNKKTEKSVGNANHIGNWVKQ